MKNILIIRSANFKVMDDLLKYIAKTEKGPYKISCLIQKNVLSILQKKYTEIKYIVCEEGFFEYRKIQDSKIIFKELTRTSYEDIYIPSSYSHFNNMYEIIKIVTKIKKKRVIMFNNVGQTYVKRIDNIIIIICRQKIEIAIGIIKDKFRLFKLKSERKFVNLKLINTFFILIVIYIITYPIIKLLKIISRIRRK